MIHGGLVSDTTPMSMRRACSTTPTNVPPSQKTIQTTRMSVVCRASFIAAPKEPVPRYTLKPALADPDLCGTQLSGNFARLASKRSHYPPRRCTCLAAELGATRFALRFFSRARCPFRCIEPLQRLRVLRRSQAESTYGISECLADNHFYLCVKRPQPLQALLEVSG